MKKSMLESYKLYAEALKNKDIHSAITHAKHYNYYLKQLGGPEKNPTESYLSMGSQWDIQVINS